MKRNAEDLEPGWYWTNFADKYGKDHGDWEVVDIRAGNLYRVGCVGRETKYYRNMEFIKVVSHELCQKCLQQWANQDKS